MFIIPKWEEDVPNTNTNFGKIKQKKTKKSNGIIHSKPKLKQKKKSVISKLPLNLKSNDTPKTIRNVIVCKKVENTKATNEWKNTIKKDKSNTKLKRKRKDEDCDVSSEIQNFDTDKPDEIILNNKKKKLNEAFKKDDVEDLLFTEKTSQMVLTENSRIKNEIKDTKKRIKHKKETIHSKKVQHSVNPMVGKTSHLIKNKTNTNKFNKVENDDLQNVHPTNKCNDDSKINKNTCKEFETVPKNISKGHTINLKKEKLKKLLDTSNIQRNSITTNASNLRHRMLERLKAAQFRYLNEKLYTSSGSEAQQLFQSDPAAFQTYHEGYQQQLKKWPVNPLEIFINRIQKLPKSHIIADMGCGEAMLSRRVPQAVRSFDLVASSPVVEVCDIAHTPLLTASVDVVVYCLALMGTNLTQYLVEANRVLKIGGLLLIAEVESRFDKVEDFTRSVQQLGFNLKKLDKGQKVFFFMEFSKVRDSPSKKSKLPMLTLKPCLYKKR